MSKLLAQLNNWLDDRTGYKSLLNEALYERIPGGARWRYVWGSTLVFTFVVQMITGIFLWMAYSPSSQTAWESVYYINNEMFLGNIVRGIHHFAAQAMVVLLAIHLVQVVIDGAYKAPREVNYWLGLILMLIVFGLSLTGYLLPWDQKGYYATQVSTKIAGATPVVGQQVQELVQGGPKYGHHTLTRFFGLHAGVLPGLLIAFLGLHLYVFRRHGITTPDPDRAPTTTFWPDQVLKDAVACLAVLAVVLLLAVFKGAELSPPANPSEAYSAARPEWYFLFLFRFLKFEWVEHQGLAFGAIYVPGAIMTILFLMPLIAKWKHGHVFNKLFIGVMALGIAFLTGLAMYEDANNPEHQLAIEDAEIEGERIQELAGRETKIPVEGASSLLAQDPFIQGPKIFAKRCAACHRWDGHNGQRRLVLEQEKLNGKMQLWESAATAADLGKHRFGTRDWMREALLNYRELFNPLTEAGWYKAHKSGEREGDFIDPETSSMGDFSDKHRKVFLDNPEALDAIVEYFAKRSGRKDLEPFDEKLAAEGLALIQDAGREATPAEGDKPAKPAALLKESCWDCHAGTVEEEDYGLEGPTLVGYGSKDWLKSFIANPGADRHYGDRNQMPRYNQSLSETDMNLLVDWMVKDYHATEITLPEVHQLEPSEE